MLFKWRKEEGVVDFFKYDSLKKPLHGQENSEASRSTTPAAAVRVDLRSLSKRMLLRFCVLCGTDYSHRIKYIGPHAAFQLIKSVDDVESDEEVGVFSFYFFQQQGYTG